MASPFSVPQACILLVDDSSVNLFTLKALLSNRDYSLVEAHSGQDAIAHTQTEEFAVILLDVRMPGLDGFETARIIRSQERSRTTPIIFLTAGDADRDELEQGYALGAVDFLTKPLLACALQAKVDGLARIFLAQQRAKHEAQVLRLLIQGTTDYAIFMLSPEGHIATWNSGAERLKGYKAEEIIGQHFSKFYPQEAIDRGWPDHELKVAQNEGRFEDEGWRVRKDGSLFWANVIITALFHESGELRGFLKITRDMTDRKKSEEHALRLMAEKTARRIAEENAQVVHEQRERLRLALEAGQMGVWDWNIRTGEIKWSESLEPLHGLTPGSFEGTFEAFQQLIHPGDRERVINAIQQAVASGTGYEIEFRNIWPNGSVHWIAGKGMVFASDDDYPERMIGVGMDVTQRKRSEQISRFLADAAATLAVLDDFERTLQKVAMLAVPDFADWVAIDLLEDGVLRRVAVAHVDPEKVALGHDVYRRFPPDPDTKHGAWHIARTGQSELVTEINDEMLAQSVKDPELLSILRELGLKSYIGVPLRARGQILGIMTFISAESGHLYDETDLSAAQDLADRGAIAIENNRLYRELQEAHRRKDEFLATLAHELRNPLAPIRNSLQILNFPRVDAVTARQTREIMERQVHHLTRLVDDLLDVSRVMRGKIELRKEAVEVATIIARAVETAQPLLDAQRHRLNVHVPDESLHLEADPIRLVQAVGNLLTNAAKYTEPQGHIELSVRRDGHQAVVSVRDNGIGIAPDMLLHVFELFVQADHASSKTQGGLGIGLTLVKNLVEMHHGIVEAHSAGLGQGCEFIVRLPLVTTMQIEAGNTSPATEQDLVPGHRLLVVDDNRDAALSLSMLLRIKGHDVRVAHDGPSALELAATFRPHMIFLDLGMPGMDGYEVARRLRTTPGQEETVLAALTGWGQEEDRRRTAEAGFNHHLIKPPELKAVENLLLQLDAPVN